MWNVANDVARWRAEGGDAAVARAVSFSGLAGRRPGEALAVGPDGERAGTLLGGSADAAVSGAALRVGGDFPIELLDVAVGDSEAVDAGLACGGIARVIVQDAASIPDLLWSSLIERRPVALATVVGSAPAPALVLAGGVVDGDLEPAELRELVVDAARELLAGGREATRTVEHGSTSVLVEAFVPLHRLLVVSEPGVIADALTAQAGLLGWEAIVSGDLEESLAAVGELTAGDALVVLTHDHDIDCAVLAAALAGDAFVGALGSRNTQRRRQERLAELGVGEELRARIHGPVGLDLGARVPPETALAICAEILAVRSGRDAASLSAGSGPING
jgi:xanthine dehydrogenase accessory factor